MNDYSVISRPRRLSDSRETQLVQIDSQHQIEKEEFVTRISDVAEDASHQRGVNIFLDNHRDRQSSTQIRLSSLRIEPPDTAVSPSFQLMNANRLANSLMHGISPKTDAQEVTTIIDINDHIPNTSSPDLNPLHYHSSGSPSTQSSSSFNVDIHAGVSSSRRLSTISSPPNIVHVHFERGSNSSGRLAGDFIQLLHHKHSLLHSQQQKGTFRGGVFSSILYFGFEYFCVILIVCLESVSSNVLFFRSSSFFFP